MGPLSLHRADHADVVTVAGFNDLPIVLGGKVEIVLRESNSLEVVKPSGNMRGRSQLEQWASMSIDWNDPEQRLRQRPGGPFHSETGRNLSGPPGILLRNSRGHTLCLGAPFHRLAPTLRIAD
jgi:hypothetical protein